MMRSLAILATLAVVTVVPAQYRLTSVASGLGGALFVTHVPGDADRLFVVQQSGVIRVIENGTLLPTPFLNVASRIRAGGERGLLGLAFPADHAQSGLFYISFTRAGDGASVLARLSVSSANRNVADPASYTQVFGPVSQPFSNHNGGCIQFGPDGYLYYGLGDGGSSGDPSCFAQNTRSYLGKMLRLDMSTTPASAPADNPFVNDPNVLDEIWSLGWRNPWRFSFDPETGDLYVGDVGQNAEEEISFQPATSTGGENYGWKIMEGNRCFSTSNCQTGVPPCNSPLLTDPIYTYGHSLGCSVTGGVVYRGCAIPSLNGTYFFGDYCSGTIWSFRYENGQVNGFRNWQSLIGRVGSLTSFGQDAAGELYVVSGSGTVFRLESTVNTANDLGFGTAGGNGQIPAFSVCGLLTQGESAEFRLDGAAPNAAAAVVGGPTNNPTTFPGLGIVVPNPATFGIPVLTDADGKVAFRIPGGGGQATGYLQCAVIDSGAQGGIALSNALEVFFF